MPANACPKRGFSKRRIPQPATNGKQLAATREQRRSVFAGFLVKSLPVRSGQSLMPSCVAIGLTRVRAENAVTLLSCEDSTDFTDVSGPPLKGAVTIVMSIEYWERVFTFTLILCPGPSPNVTASPRSALRYCAKAAQNVLEMSALSGVVLSMKRQSSATR